MIIKIYFDKNSEPKEVAMTWKIVVDSGCNLKQLENLPENVRFESVPLTLQIGNEVYIDDEKIDIPTMMEKLYSSQAAASSACPSPDAFLSAYRGADRVIVLTITGALSGSHNAAQLAKNLLLEEKPDTEVHVIDSLSAGGENDLLVLKLVELIAQGLSFDQVVTAITAYQEKTKLLFILEKVDNLVKNGRLSKLAGKVVGMLNIRLVGEASSEGTLELLHKARGQKKSISSGYAEMLKAGYQGGRVMLSHAYNDKLAEQFSKAIKADFPKADVRILPTSGLCSFYAEDGGILMGYEI